MISPLVICGPTATGKTKLAVYLAQKFNGEILSTDSRQVYRGMDIGTGKDIPKEFRIQNSEFRIKNRYVNFYSGKKTKIWGLDLVNPDEDFSVYDYQVFATSVILDMHRREKLPIIVGGTGLYIKALLEPLNTIAIPLDKTLRKKLNNKSVMQLQKILQEKNKKRFSEMNNSDRNNPRRLIRAIEIAHYTQATSSRVNVEEQYYFQELGNPLVICLTASLTILKSRINNRVENRLKQGVLSEIQTLLQNGYSWDLPAMSGLGYRQWKSLFQTKDFKMDSLEYEEKKEQIIEKWKTDEYKYAKRQLTWFKKQKNMHWVDITQYNWLQIVVDRIRECYTKIR